MKNFKYTKTDLANYIKHNYFLEEILCVNPRKHVYISIKKNVRNISWRYEFCVIVERVMFWKKEWNNYLLILDELHEFLNLKKLLPEADLKAVRIDLDISDSIFENETCLKNETRKTWTLEQKNFQASRKPQKILPKIPVIDELKMDLEFFETALVDWRLDDLTDLIKNFDDEIEILDTKNWLVWVLKLHDEIWKKLLAIYLFNLPMRYKKGLYVPETIIVIFWDNIMLKIFVQESMLENTNEIRDDELPYILFHMNDFFVMKSSLECWVDELFESFKVNKVKMICF